MILNCLVYCVLSYGYTYKPLETNINDALVSKASIIIMGDSHAAVIGNGILDGNVFNAALDSDSYGDIYLKISSFHDRGYLPSKLIIPADYHVFSEYRATKNNFRTTASIAPLASLSMINGNSVSHNIFLKYLSKFLPLFDMRNNNLILIQAYNKVKDLFSKGESSNERDWSVVSESDQISKRNGRFAKHFRQIIDEKNTNDFKTLVNFCISQEISLTAMRYPVDRAYLEMIPLNLKNSVDSIFMHYGIEIDDQSSFFSEQHFFADQDHMNKRGAEVFVEYINDKY